MPKCESCSKGICKGQYELRNECKDPDNCSCTCQERADETFAKGFLSVAGGVAAFAGGVVLTVSTGGLGAVGIAAAIGGGALTGIGATAAITPIAKKMNDERITGGEYVKDLVVGGTVGAMTGGIGLGGASVTTSLASKVGTETVKQGAVKLGCRAATGAVCGATAGIVQETGNVIADKDAEFSVINVLKSTALGAVTGTASHVTGSLTNNMNPGLTCSATKVATDTVATAAIDSAYQLVTEGEIDPKKLALNVGARAATSAGYEAVASATYAVHGGKEALGDKLADKELLKNASDDDKEKIFNAKQNIETMDPETVASEVNKAIEATIAKNEIAENTQAKSKVEELRNKVNDKILDVKNDPNIAPEDRRNAMQTLQAEKDTLQKQCKKHNNAIITREKNMPQVEHIGEQRIHALESDHLLQFAADLPDPNKVEGTPGARRVLFDVKHDFQGKVQAKIAGVIENHDYANAPGYDQRPQMKIVEPFIIPEERENDDEDKKKKKA